MKSVAVVTPFYMPHLGGMERALWRLSTALARAGLDVGVHTSGIGWPGGPHESEEDGVLVRREGRSLGDWSRAARSWSVAKRQQLDAVIFASFGPETRDETARAAIELRTANVRTVWRSPTADHALRNLSGRLRNLLDGVSIVVANSNASGDRTAAATGRDVVVIPNMLLQDELSVAKVDAAADRLCGVTWVGRVARRKLPWQLLEFLKQLAAFCDVHVQATPGYGEEQLFREFISAMPARVHIHRAAAEQPMVIRRASVFLHMSEVEGSPNSVLEAAARGCAPLTSDIPECSELLAGLTSATSVSFGRDALESIERLIAWSQGSDDRLTQHGRIAERFSERRVVQHWLEVLVS